MQNCQKLIRGPNSVTPANTGGRGRLLRIRRASCGAHLRRSTTSVGAVSTIGPAMMAGALLLRLSLYAGSAACWNTRQKPEHGRHMGWPHPLAWAGSGALMADGFARCGKAPTVIEQRRRHGSTTSATMRRCNCAGIGRMARTRLDTTISAVNRRISRRLEGAKPTQRRLSFETRSLHWRDMQRESSAVSHNSVLAPKSKG